MSEQFYLLAIGAVTLIALAALVLVGVVYAFRAILSQNVGEFQSFERPERKPKVVNSIEQPEFPAGL